MSTSGLKLSTRSEADMRDELAKKDRAGWVPIGGNHIALRGEMVAQCEWSKDRDLILTMARSYDAMREALETISEGTEDAAPPYRAMPREDMKRIARAALSLANGSKPSTDEEGGLRI